MHLSPIPLLFNLCSFFSPLLKNGMAKAAIVIIKLEMPSPIPAVVKRLFPEAGRPTLFLIPAVVKKLLPDAKGPTLAFIPAPPKGVDKSTLPLKVKGGDISNRYLLRLFDCLAHPNLGPTFATDQR